MGEGAWPDQPGLWPPALLFPSPPDRQSLFKVSETGDLTRQLSAFPPKNKAGAGLWPGAGRGGRGPARG